MDELLELLARRKIKHSIVDDEVVDIIGFGEMFVSDIDSDDTVDSVFKKLTNDESELELNLTCDVHALNDEGIFYIAFKFGDDWYYHDTREEFKFREIRYIGERMECVNKSGFVNLGVHTPYELLNGSGDLSKWSEKARFLGHTALGICDKNTMAGTLPLQKQCQSDGLKFIFGYTLDVQLSEEEIFEAKVYSLTNTGKQNMLRIQKEIMVDSTTQTIDIDTLVQYGEGNVFVFGTLSAQSVIVLSENGDDYTLSKAALKIEKFFDDVYYQVDATEYKADRIDVQYLESLKHFFNNAHVKDYQFLIQPILITDQYYVDQEDRKNKINLNKIAGGAAHNQSDEQYYKDVDDHYETLFPLFDDSCVDFDSLFSSMCKPTVDIAERACAFFETDRNFMPEYTLTESELEEFGDRRTMFRELLERGFKKLVPKGKEEEYRDRLEKEIYVIESTNNLDYMLVQYDTVRWARDNGILVGAGRGSAGGSLILYLLGITLVDPIKYNLLFERFLLPERAGLYASDTTVLYEPIDATEYVEVEFENGKSMKIACDAMLLVKDGDEMVEAYADTLMDGDEVIFDNKHLLWDI